MAEKSISKDEKDALFSEYFKAVDILQMYDSYFIDIKKWGVTTSGIAIGAGIAEGQALVFLVALILSLSFWLTEVFFKLLQLGHTLRVSELEYALQTSSEASGPRILGSFGEQRAADLRAKRWRTVLLWPQVMLPHIFFVAISGLMLLIEAVRNVLGK